MGATNMAQANEAMLPFYVLHQTVLLTVGSFVVRWPMPDLARWALIFAISLTVCLGIYWFLIKIRRLSRPLLQ